MRCFGEVVRRPMVSRRGMDDEESGWCPIINSHSQAGDVSLCCRLLLLKKGQTKQSAVIDFNQQIVYEETVKDWRLDWA